MKESTNYKLRLPEDHEYFDEQAHEVYNYEQIDAILAPTADPELAYPDPMTNGPHKLASWVGWIVKLIKSITGKANWWEVPVKSIQQLSDDTAGQAGELAAHKADTAPHAAAINMPHMTTGNLTLYVDTTNGNDTNDGLAAGAGHALQTISAAIPKIPQVVNHIVTINVAAGTYNETVKLGGYSGGGLINIYGDTVVSANYNINNLHLSNCTCQIYIRGLRATSTVANGFAVVSSLDVKLNYCSCISATSIYQGVIVNNAIVQVSNSQFSNRGNGLLASYGSIVFSNSNNGTANILGINVGAGIVYISGTQPSGSSGNGISAGGQILDGPFSSLSANKTINVPADYATIQVALDSLSNTYIPPNVLVVIQVAAGTLTHTSAINITHPNGDRIQIVGAAPVSTTVSSVGSVTGSAGNWSVPVTVSSVVGIAINDYVIMRNLTGTGDFQAHSGCWQITAINGLVVTIKNTHRKATFPTSTLAGGDFIVLKTILKFNGCIGIRVQNKHSGYIDKVAIIGDASNNYGVYVATNSMLTSGIYVGINGFGNYGLVVSANSVVLSDYIVVSNCSNITNWSGIISGSGSILVCAYAISSGNRGDGFYAPECGYISANQAISVGNEISGFHAYRSSFITAIQSISLENGGPGFFAMNSSGIDCGNSINKNNGIYGMWAVMGSSIGAASTLSSGNNTADYCASTESIIHVYGYTGSPVFSPALEAVGNKNAIITVNT